MCLEKANLLERYFKVALCTIFISRIYNIETFNRKLTAKINKNMKNYNYVK